jgi:hypothetical protein
VGDDHGGAADHEAVEGLLDHLLRLAVQRRRGLVQEQLEHKGSKAVSRTARGAKQGNATQPRGAGQGAAEGRIPTAFGSDRGTCIASREVLERLPVTPGGPDLPW